MIPLWKSPIKLPVELPMELPVLCCCAVLFVSIHSFWRSWKRFFCDLLKPQT